MSANAAAIEVREAAAEDASVLSELGERTFRSAFSASNTARDIDLYVRQAFAIGTVRRELADHRNGFLLALDAGCPIGYAKFREASAPVKLPGNTPLELHRLYLESGAVGRGVGAALLRACFTRAVVRGADAIWLGVWERNTRAIEFYRRWKFETVGAHVFQLGNDAQTDLIMSRRVGGEVVRCPDIAAVKRLLESVQLPTADVDVEKLRTFFYCRSGGDISGIIGLEIHQSVALLRSLVVMEEWRSTGVGARLVNHAEAFAKAQNIVRIYLLTTTASKYFKRRGYTESSRDAVPEAIRQTTEFSNLCPSTATLMVKDLGL